ncbi:MAG: YiiX/YebB-like N1pC/P60 family cysteine hydrolase [Gammaproteobacteria bacterium]|nr:YiiX/YebB-like N1pC/P60 family cysteine hydrolase [Gammaproteobacteria bacterium]
MIKTVFTILLNSCFARCRSLVLVMCCLISPLSAADTAGLFSWQRDSFFQTIEQTFEQARQQPLSRVRTQFVIQLAQGKRLLNAIRLATDGVPFGELKRLEEAQFYIATLAAAHESLMIEAHGFLTDARLTVLSAAVHWPTANADVHDAIYRVVYGGRAAIEEALVQHKGTDLPALTLLEDVPSATPSVVVEGVRVHSGDIILTRGDAPTSAMIARGNPYPANFSHVALVHVDELTGTVTVVESLIEHGVVSKSVTEFLKEKRHRLLLLRLRPGNGVLELDPLAPHHAASYMLDHIKQGRIAYDFSMNWNDASEMFCSEVAYHAYRSTGIDLWARKSKLESPGLIRWLGDVGMQHFTTILPSDIEYDPRLAPVAEWRNLETLRSERLDNVTLDVLLEAGERGDRLSYAPLAALPGGAIKLWSKLKSVVGLTPTIPAGMSVDTALRVRSLIKKVHPELRAAITIADTKYQTEHGYATPYWSLTNIARQLLIELKDDLSPGLWHGRP